MIDKKVGKDIIFIILISILAALIVNSFSSNSLPLLRIEPKNGDSDEKNDNIIYINVNEAYRMFIQSEAIFVDSRSINEYNNCHILDALLLPYYNFEEYYPKIKKELIGKKIIIYCDGEGCLLSLKLARKLSEMGYKNIYVMIGGLPTWLANKYPASCKFDSYSFYPNDSVNTNSKVCK